MSEIDHGVRRVFDQRPELAKCARLGLVNRRALARFMIQHGAADRRQMDAVVATLRRYDFGEEAGEPLDLFPEVRVTIKDRILILDYAKERGLLARLPSLLGQIDYDRGDTFKVVLGTSSLKLFLDERRDRSVEAAFRGVRPRATYSGLSEMSLLFPDVAIRTPNVLGVVTREFALHGIVITEMLTASPELLLYLPDEHVPEAHAVLRELKRGMPEPRR